MNRSVVRMAALLGALIVGACHQQEEVKEVELQSFPVRVQAVQRQTLEENLTVVASLKAESEATLFARVPGKLLRNAVKEGDPIARGQAVAYVERDEVGVKFEPAPVPSTISGSVARVYLDKGEEVTLTTPIALVVSQGKIVAQADIPERYAGRVKRGQNVRVRVEAYPNKVFQGKISRVSPVVNSNTRTAYMEATLDNQEHELQSGMFAKLDLVLEHREGVFALEPSHFPTAEHDFIFVVENGKAVKKSVVTGMQTETLIEVKSGLNENDKVITFGLFGLQDGSPVQVLP